MKLHKLIINNTRGIRELNIEPKGENFLVWGPNGSGKSGVIDSIDFLLTGCISRLTGRGTRGISLSSHGSHIDCDINSAWVEGTFQIPGIDELVTLKRRLKTPNVLEYNENFEKVLEPILNLAKRGQHVLTRRDILRYIASEANTRAKEIQELLNITEIENIRSGLVRVKTHFKNECEVSENLIENSKARIISITRHRKYSVSSILQFVNEKRILLKGKPISELESSKIKVDLSPPILLPQNETVNLSRLESDIGIVSELSHVKHQREIEKSDLKIREVLDELSDTPQKMRDLALLELLEQGLELIDETGDCPLCDTSWPEGELKKYLESKRQKSQAIGESKDKLGMLCSELLSRVRSVQSSIERILNTTRKLEEEEKEVSLKKWYDDLSQYVDSLLNPMEKYPKLRYSQEEIKKLFLSKQRLFSVQEIKKKAQYRYPELTPEQRAWDTLTEIETNLKGLEKALSEHKKNNLHSEQAEILYNSFIESRDEVLQTLYDKIRGRFIEFYRFLHSADEGKFDANIEPSGAGLKFEVDFYGRGTHPPQALHSEGHQDSMGICLWLALSEQLTQKKIDLILLDDVVMSVDTDHRRKVADLLGLKFEDRQFLITTHDRNWMNQLKSGAIVRTNNVIHFYDWDIDQGPHISFRVDMWSKINGDLEKNDISEAAARLRHGSEEFFRAVCSALEVPVVFKEDYKWELGELQLPAMEHYKNLLKLAIRSAESWGKQEKVEEYRELDSIRSSIYRRTYADQWSVNESLHYNNWENFSYEDFRPVVDAFHDLFDLYFCQNCGGILRLQKVNRKKASLRCSCGKKNWNLVIKLNN